MALMRGRRLDYCVPERRRRAVRACCQAGEVTSVTARTTTIIATSVQAPARASSQVKTIPKTGALWVVARTAPAPASARTRS